LEHRVGGALEVQLGLPPHGRRPRHAATEARAVVLGEGALLRGGEREARGHLRNGTSSAVVTESSAGVTESRAGVTESRAGVTESRAVVTESRAVVTESSAGVTERRAGVRPARRARLVGRPPPARYIG